MSGDKLNHALNIMRRMPPASTDNSLAGLIEICPDLTDDLLNHVDQPLEIQEDETNQRPFILCDYNRDGDSYRSPWSGQYFPALSDGFKPTDKLRQMEIEANSIFDTYRKLYFESGNSSVYFFNTDEKEEDAFGACFLIHKDVPEGRGLSAGVWDSIHVFDVKRKNESSFDYSLTTTVLLSMKVDNNKVGAVDLSGSMTKQAKKTSVFKERENPHIANMGAMLEQMELDIRNSIENVYVQKTREILNGIRKASGSAEEAWKKVAPSLAQSVAAHGQARKVDSQ